MIALGLMMATFIGCGGGGGSSSSEGTPPPAGAPLPARVLSWEAPTSYVDTTAMDPVTDLDRFEIHVNETGTFADADPPVAAVSAVDPATRTLLQPGQPQPSRESGTSILRVLARRRTHGAEIRLLPAGFLFLLIAPFRPVA